MSSLADPSALPVEIPPRVESPPPGQMLGKYELLKVLGQGAMGQVYLAKHALLGRQMAIKLLRPEHATNSDLVVRFFQEARAVNQINHQHIVQIFDFVQEPAQDGKPGWVYCVMEILEGESLSERLKAKPLSLGQVITVGRQVSGALEAAHRVGVVHRDIKPDNIFVTERDGAPFAKVLDFGVAKLSRTLDQIPLVSTTQQGAMIGTPAYMSPEQAAGLDIDYRTDIYSLGAVLFEALAGHVPFTSPSFGKLLVEIITGKVPELPGKTPSGEVIPPGLAAVVRRCLAKQPGERPASMAELGGELAKAGDGGPVAVAPTRRRMPWLVVGASAAAAVGLAVWSHASGEPPAPPPIAVAATPRPTAAVPAPPPVPATVSVQITSEPPGASVVRVDTGAVWGTTPLTLTLPREAKDVPLRLERAGFIAQSSAVRLERDVALTVSLPAVPAPPAAKVSRSTKGKRKGKEVSQDGDIDPFAQ